MTVKMATSNGGSGEKPLLESDDGYVSDLLSYSLDRLNKEPELLKSDSERIQRQLQEVAVKHYRAFITTAECIKTVHEQVESVSQHLHSLLEGLPVLQAGCKEFSAGAEQIAAKRLVNRQMLSQHGALLDLLEVPQLIDTCVRNGNYDEALDLEAFMGKLCVLHQGVPAVHDLQAEVKAISQSMLQQLLVRLQSAIHLPECLRVIGYLRRMSVFSEREMRQNFLQCREAWFASVVEELDRDQSYDFLKRLTDCHRMHLFDVVMQYRAIFADDTSSADATSDGGLVYSWAMHRVSAYLLEVESALDRIADGSALASVLDHCMYCGMSLGRVGLDFRGLLPSIFQKRIHAIVASALSRALEVLERSLHHHRWLALPAVSADTLVYNASDDGASPPYSLMDHPPVAVFTNGVLAALNELRHCAPAALQQTLAAALHDTLLQGASMLLRYHVTHTLQDSEAALFLAMVRTFAEVAAPFLATCFGRVYGGDSMVHLPSALEPLRELLLLRASNLEEETTADPAKEETKDETSQVAVNGHGTKPSTEATTKALLPENAASKPTPSTSPPAASPANELPIDEIPVEEHDLDRDQSESTALQ